METRKTRGVGFIFYIILIAIIFVVVFAIRQNGKNAVNYTYEGFINDLADGKVKDEPEPGDSDRKDNSKAF